MPILCSPALHRLAPLALLLCGLSAQAHHVWLEQPASGNGSATLYFGEFGGNLREASPGLLDKFVKPLARKLSPQGEQALTLHKGATGFALGARAKAGEALIAEEPGYPISERKDGDKTVRSVYHPAARLVMQWSGHKPHLLLDLLPTGKQDKAGVELQAFYKGQPLPKAKVALVTPSGWMQEHHSGEDGKLTVPLPWRGTYVLEVSHRVNEPGQRAGIDGQPESFDRASYVTSLTLTQDKGLPPLPAAPAATPNKPY